MVFADEYMRHLPRGSVAKAFCEIPYDLATATIDSIERGLPKLTRQQVIEICKIPA